MTRLLSLFATHGAVAHSVAPGQFIRYGICLGIAGAICGCSPTVQVQAPDKPIEINLNVKIEQEVRIKLEREVEDLVKKNDALF